MDENNSRVLSGIKNGQRWDDFVSSIEDESERSFVSSLVSFPDFSEWAEGKNIDSLGLWRARQDKLLYGHLPPPLESPPPEQKEGYRLDLGNKPSHGHKPESAYKNFRDGAHEKAWKDASEWNKTKDPSKAMSFLHAYELSLQKSYDELAGKNEGLARNWAKTHGDRRLDTSVKRTGEKREAKKKGLPAPDYSWNPMVGFLNRLALVEKIAKNKTGEKPETLNEIRERLLQELAQKSPREFAEYVFNKYAGREIQDDEALASVVKRQRETALARQKTEVEKDQKAIEKSLRKYKKVETQRLEWREKTFPTPPPPQPKKRKLFSLPRLRRRTIPAPVSETPITTGVVNVANRVFSGGERGLPKRFPNPLPSLTKNLGIPNPFSRLTRGFGFPNPVARFNPVSLVEKQILRMLLFSIGGVFLLTFLIAAVAIGGGGGLGTGVPEQTIVSPSPSPGEPAPSEQPPPSGDIEQALLNDFNVRLSVGGAGFCLWSSNWRDPYAPGEVISEDAKRKIYSAIAAPAQSARFRNLIKEKTVTIEFYKGEHIFGCRDGNKITFMNFGRYVNIMGERGPGFFIVHEFGHIIGGRSNLNNLFPHDSLKRSPTDADCYNAHGILKSYGLIRDPKGESFAEAIALYIYNKKDGIMDFKNECPATHDWIGGNVFVN